MGIALREKTCHSQILPKERPRRQRLKKNRFVPFKAQSEQSRALPECVHKGRLELQGYLESVICGNGAELKRKAQSAEQRRGSLGCAGREQGQLLSRLHKTRSELAERSRPSLGRDPVPAQRALQNPTNRAQTMAHKAPTRRPRRDGWRTGRLRAARGTRRPGAHSAGRSLPRTPRCRSKHGVGGQPGRAPGEPTGGSSRGGENRSLSFLFCFAHFVFFFSKLSTWDFVIRNTKTRGV